VCSSDLEFGVFRGESLRRLAPRAPDRTFYGFDSFAGFPEDDRPDWRLDFSVAGVPETPANVRLVKGWFSETAPRFFREHDDPVAMVHLDCDIYSSARDVLGALVDAGRATPGLVVVMDEGINYDTFAWNEMLALFEVCARAGLGVRPLFVHDKVRGLAETLELVEAGRHPSWRADQAAGYRQQAAVVLTDAPVAPPPACEETTARFLRLTAAREAAQAA